MTERRGFAKPNGRELRYCADCKATSAFVSRTDAQGRKVLICVGDERSPNPRSGCGKVLLDTGVKRFYGECMNCRQMQRAVAMPDGTYRCAICARNIHSVEEYHGD